MTGTAAWTEGAGCATTWQEIMERSYVQVEEISGGELTSATVSEQGDHSRSAAENITTHAVWDRYLSLIQGRSGYAPIKVGFVPLSLRFSRGKCRNCPFSVHFTKK